MVANLRISDDCNWGLVPLRAGLMGVQVSPSSAVVPSSLSTLRSHIKYIGFLCVYNNCVHMIFIVLFATRLVFNIC